VIRQVLTEPPRIPGWTTMHEAAAALVLFRLGGRGYACPRDKVRQVVDVGAGQPPVPGLEPSSLGGLRGAQRPLRLVSLRLALGLPDHGPEGRILVVSTRHGPVGFLVDEVLRVLEVDPAATRLRESRLGSGYVVDTVEALGTTWMLVDFEALRLPVGPGPPGGGAPRGGP
jgi:chemotaxis signal transduction protein